MVNYMLNYLPLLAKYHISDRHFYLETTDSYVLSLHVLRHGGPADFNMVSFFLSFFLSVHAYRLISQKLLVGLRSNFAFLLGFRSEKNY